MSADPHWNKMSRRSVIGRTLAGVGCAMLAPKMASIAYGKDCSPTGIVDAHVHIGNGRLMQQDVDTLLRRMDEAHVAVAIACPMDVHTAVANREGNDLILKAVKAHPDRLLGMGVANPWFGNKAVFEIRRSLEAGLSGIYIHSVLQGFRLSDGIVDPLLQVAADFDVPVYAHTGTAGLAEPFHIVELATRFPHVHFIMGHGGASDYYNDAVRGLEFVNNVWIESSRNGPANYCLWKASGIGNRIVFGSGNPEYIPEIELQTLADVFTDPADREQILYKTIQSVFKGRLPI